jgi:TPR repeat protein
MFSLVFQFLSAQAVQAQYKGARDYTKRLNPVLSPPPRPTAPPAAVAAPNRRPTSPADVEKAKTEKAERLKRVVEFEKEQAEAGSPTYQYALGLRYLTGDGLEKDLPTARSWFEKAAKNGNKDAIKKLEELKKQDTAEPAQKRKGPEK